MSTPHTPKGATKEEREALVARLRETLADKSYGMGLHIRGLAEEAADAIVALQAENGELRKEVEASRFHVNQVGQAHEFLDALSVPESEPDAGGGPPVFLSLAERIAYTAMNDDWDEPSKLVHEILSRSSHPAWHDEQREKAEAERDEALRTVGELKEVRHCEGSGEPCVDAQRWWEAQDEIDALKELLPLCAEFIRTIPPNCGHMANEQAGLLTAIAKTLGASPPPTVEGEG